MNLDYSAMSLKFYSLGISAGLVVASTIMNAQAPFASARMPYQISQIAENVTVKISSQSSGSGVIIKQNKNTYTVLTAAHVVETEDDYFVTTPDGQTIKVDQNTIRRLEAIDLAILEFSSQNRYDLAELGDSTQVREGEKLFISGFPVKTLAIDKPIYSFTEGKVIASSSQSLSDGYALVYSNNTLPGMSGGPIFNDQGQLVGIHGRADASSQNKAATLNPNIWIKTGFNLGIPLNSFLLAIEEFAPNFSTRQPVRDDTSSFGSSEYFVQGMSRMRALDFPGAIESFTQAIDQSPDFYEARLRRAYAYVYRSIYHSTGNTERDMGAALIECTKLIKTNPNNAQGYACRGFVHSYLFNNTEALTDFNRAIALEPSQGTFFYDRGASFYRRKDYPKAIQDLSRAIDLNRNDILAYRLRGLVYYDQSDFRRAIEDFSQAIQLNPDEAKYFALRGAAHSKVGDYLKAVEDFSNTSPPNFEERGKAYAALKENQKALEDLNRAIKNSPYTEGDNGYRYYYRGLVLSRLGRTKLAIQDLKTAIAGFNAVPTFPPRIEKQKAIELLTQLES